MLENSEWILTNTSKANSPFKVWLCFPSSWPRAAICASGWRGRERASGPACEKHGFIFYWQRVRVEPAEYGPRSDVGKKKGRLLNNSSELIKRVEPYRCRRRPLGKGRGGGEGGVSGGCYGPRKAAYKGSFVESRLKRRGKQGKTSHTFSDASLMS